MTYCVHPQCLKSHLRFFQSMLNTKRQKLVLMQYDETGTHGWLIFNWVTIAETSMRKQKPQKAVSVRFQVSQSFTLQYETHVMMKRHQPMSVRLFLFPCLQTLIFNKKTCKSLVQWWFSLNLLVCFHAHIYGLMCLCSQQPSQHSLRPCLRFTVTSR